MSALEQLIADHDAAILARLRDHDYLKPVVFDGKVPTLADGTPRNAYVNVHASGRPYAAERRNAAQIQVARTYLVHSVSTDPKEARRLQGAVVAQLLNFRPLIPGRRAFRLTYEASTFLRPDESTSEWLWYTTDQFDLNTTPARGGTHG